MFIGEYNNKLDEKKRVSIPVKFRLGLGRKAVITKGLDGCLYLYPAKDWEKLAKKLGDLPLVQSDARGFARIMLTGAMEVILDRLGRIVIPEYLKKYASFSKNVIIAGVYNRIEIWEEKKWNLYIKKTEKGMEDMAERLKELGI